MLSQIFDGIKPVILLLSYLSWRDYIEILFFSTTIYYFALWLKRDKQKNLLYPFFVYNLLLFVSYYLYLPTLSNILFLSMPVVVIIFITLHEQTLQKNFIMLQKVKAPEDNSLGNWQEELLKISLSALNKNKELIFVIEKYDSLDHIIHTPFKFYADLQKDILEILIEKHICTPNYFIWLNKGGKLIAINSTWHFNFDQDWLDPELKKAPKWKQDNILVSDKTDAIIFKINPLSRNFDLIINGKLAEALSPQEALMILKRNLYAPRNNNSNLNYQNIKHSDNILEQ